MAGRRPPKTGLSMCESHDLAPRPPPPVRHPYPKVQTASTADDMGPFQLYVTSIAIWGEAMSEAERVVLQARRAVGNRAASATDKQEALQALLSWQGSRGARCFTTAHAIR